MQITLTTYGQTRVSCGITNFWVPPKYGNQNTNTHTDQQKQRKQLLSLSYIQWKRILMKKTYKLHMAQDVVISCFLQLHK